MEENNQNNNGLVNSNNNEVNNQENPNNEENQNSERPNNPNNNNNFFNKSLNGINTANNIANSLNAPSSEAEPNETLDALNQMRNNAVNNMNNAANLATGMKNFKNNINNLKNKKNEDGNNKGDNNKKDKDNNKKDENNNNGNNNQTQGNNNGLPKKDDNNQKPQSGLGSSIDSPKQGLASKIKEKLGGKVKNKLGGSKEEGKTGTIKKLIKIFKALPFSIKMVILGLLIFIILLLLFLTIFIVLNGDESGSGSDDYCVDNKFDISDLKNTSSKTYTGVFEWRWDRQVVMKPMYEKVETYIDEDGFLRTGNDYIVALGTYFGKRKGTRYLITLENGTSFTAMLGDTKADIHTDPTHRFHEIDGSVLEFEMGCGTKIDPVSYGFKFKGKKPVACVPDQENARIRKKFPGNVESIKLIEGYDTCNTNGQFTTRKKEPSRSDINKVIKLAPSIANRPKYECVWYVMIRSVEIINSASNLTKEQKKAAISDLNRTYGNAWQYFPTINDGLKNFGYDETCTKPKAGSIVTQQVGVAHCSDGPFGYCGHVMIIESVNSKSKKAVVTDGYNGGGYMIWRRRTLTFAEINKNSCKGYTYLLDYKG